MDVMWGRLVVCVIDGMVYRGVAGRVGVCALGLMGFDNRMLDRDGPVGGMIDGMADALVVGYVVGRRQ